MQSLDAPRGPGSLAHFLHRHFLWLLLGSYAIAAVCPGPGLAIRDISLGRVAILGGSMPLTFPALMLGFLLLNAGLGVRLAEMRALARRPSLLLTGLAANLAIPIAFIGLVSQVMASWHNNDELQVTLVGLALVAAMPIAGSSTAWSQNADGDLALSLGLVVASTLLSPLLTPMALHTVGFLARDAYAARLHGLAENGTGAFLFACVIVPSLLGIAIRRAAGEARMAAAKPRLKLINSANLLVLCYSNAAVALPQAVAKPDWDFLAIIAAVTVALCTVAFGSGWGLARLLGLGAAGRTSLMFGLGMNNNGTGLVLASMALADYPRVMLPIILYNLVQQVVAGVAGHALGRETRPDEPPRTEPAIGGLLFPTHVPLACEARGIPRPGRVTPARRRRGAEVVVDLLGKIGEDEGAGRGEGPFPPSTGPRPCGDRWAINANR